MKVLVLMSTYNGEKFINEQIESILNQKGVDVNILIRDDGSTDKTPLMLENYEISNNSIKVIYGNNIGYERSFLYLIQENSINDYDYYAFSDQDDVWLPHKLSRAIGFFENKDICQMYWSNAMLVDANLNKLKPFYKSDYRPSYERSTKILNSGTLGCTIVFNKKLKDKISKWSSHDSYPHDFLITTIALLIGKIHYDEALNIFYRQHTSSVTGSKIGIKSKIKKAYQSFVTRKNNSYSILAQNMLKNYSGEIKKENFIILKMLCEYRDSIGIKIKLLFSDIHKETIVKTICLKIMILLNLV